MAAESTPPRPRLRLGSVRMRTTAVAVVVVGLATAAGSVLVMHFFRSSLLGQVETAARQRAAEIAAGVTTSAGLPAVADSEDLIVQLLAGDRVLASSPNVAGLPVLARPLPDDAVEIGVPVGDGEYLAVVMPLDASRSLLVALSIESVQESTSAIRGIAAIALPVLLLVVAVTTWSSVGRTLGPVEAIRREVSAMSADRLHRRVPNPPGDDEIARLARTMNEMLTRLEQARVRQQQFVSNASHELRSPVAAIRQHAEVALAHPERSSLAGLAETVLAEDLRIQRLVSDLLLLAGADERGGLAVRHRPVDLDDLVFAAARDLRAAASGLAVDTSAVSAGRVAGDAGALRRMIANIVENAARHARSRIAFALHESNGSVLLAVEDDGPGIPEGDRDRVLERFVRLDAARARDDGGSGLGLAIVAELAAAHGGTARVRSGALGGARVEVHLPALTDT